MLTNDIVKFWTTGPRFLYTYYGPINGIYVIELVS